MKVSGWKLYLEVKFDEKAFQKNFFGMFFWEAFKRSFPGKLFRKYSFKIYLFKKNTVKTPIKHRKNQKSISKSSTMKALLLKKLDFERFVKKALANLKKLILK